MSDIAVTVFSLASVVLTLVSYGGLRGRTAVPESESEGSVPPAAQRIQAAPPSQAI